MITDPTFLLYAGVLAFAALLSLVLAVLAFFRRQTPGVTTFLFGNLAGFFYAFGSILEIQARTPTELLAALTTEYFGIATLGPLLLLTTHAITRGTGSPGTGRLASLFIVPVVVVAAVATNDSHHLFYTSLLVGHRGPFTVPLLGKGPLYMVNFAYMNICILWGALTAFRGYRKARGAYRPPLLLVLVGALFPWAGMALYQAGWSPYGLDTAPLGLALACLSFGLALFRYQLFDLGPLVVDQVFANMQEGVVVLDRQGRILGVNPAVTRILPEATSASVGRTLATLGPQAQTLAQGSQELVLPGAEGTRVYQVDRSPLRDRRGDWIGQILLLSDITVRQELAAKLARLAGSDELTSLPNRRAFLGQLRVEYGRHLRYGTPFSLAMADLDHFKRVNDLEGHEAGDAALLHVAEVWKATLRSADLLARYGGEEFTILFPETDLAEARPILERMRTCLEATPLVWKGKELRLTASFGLARPLSGDGENPEPILRRVDGALYSAKERGRNQVRLAEEDQPS